MFSVIFYDRHLTFLHDTFLLVNTTTDLEVKWKIFLFAIKGKEKDISKNFLFQNSSYFFFFIVIKEEKVSKKKKKHTVFYALTSVVQMDVAGKPALLRSLKNARGANVVQF